MGEHDDTTTVTTGAELARAIGAAMDDGESWSVIGSPREAHRVLDLAGDLGELAMLGDAQVRVGGGVRLDTLSQYVQSQVGVAPGWPMGTGVTVAAAMSGDLPAGHPARAVLRQMSNALVEVEVARGSTRTTEMWDTSTVVGDDGSVELPGDAVVAHVIVGLAAAAAAVRAAAQPGGELGGPRDGQRG